MASPHIVSPQRSAGLQDDKTPARSRSGRALRSALLKTAERALRNGPCQASYKIDGVELAGVARWPRRTAEAERDFCAGHAAHHADYLRAGQSTGLGTVDGDKDVAHVDLWQGAAGQRYSQRKIQGIVAFDQKKTGVLT